MAGIGDYDARRLPHIRIDGFRETARYVVPGRRQDRSPRRPDYVGHARSLLEQLEAALQEIPPAESDPRKPIPGMSLGTIVEIGTMEPSPRATSTKVPPQFDFPNRDIVVLQTHRNIDRTEGAIVFIPDGGRAFLRDRIAEYGGVGIPFEERPNLLRFEPIEHIRSVTASALFPLSTEFREHLLWWETWVRAPLAKVDAVESVARSKGLDVHADRLRFPDTIVLLVHASAVQMREVAIATIGAISEIRPASSEIDLILDRGARSIGQNEFVRELTSRIQKPLPNAPAVTVLDTGVAAAHPLISPALLGALAFDEAWGADDHHPEGGHGTGVTSLVLHGDLTGSLTDQRSMPCSHFAISMKLLAPRGFWPHQPDRYGIVTRSAVFSTEATHHGASSIYCIACSSPLAPPGVPSTWSSALDLTAAGGNEGGFLSAPGRAADLPKRVFVVAAGNVEGGLLTDVRQGRQIEDPSQSWNALTVGGFTTKDRVPDEFFLDMRPLARTNDVSPSVEDRMRFRKISRRSSRRCCSRRATCWWAGTICVPGTPQFHCSRPVRTCETSH